MPRRNDSLTPDGRCRWCGSDPLYVNYHDGEWGFPVADDVRLFEKLCLEGFQAGLSWLTILRKRENFRRAFAGFDIGRVARFNSRSVERLVEDSGIVRHRGKIESTINNAKAALGVIEEFGSLAAYIWRFEPPERKRTLRRTLGSIPAVTDESTALSGDLRRRGFSFVGPTTCYAFMQAMGLVNDHVASCRVFGEVVEARRCFARPG